MKYLTAVLFRFLITTGYGQTVYPSPVTENLNTQQLEEIDRTITIGDKFIVIETVMNSTSSDLLRLVIKEIATNFDPFGSNRTNYTSYDDKFLT